MDGIDKTGESKASRAPVCERFFENEFLREMFELILYEVEI